MNYIRVNKLVRMGDLTIENLSSIMGMDISPNDKLVQNHNQFSMKYIKLVIITVLLLNVINIFIL